MASPIRHFSSVTKRYTFGASWQIFSLCVNCGALDKPLLFRSFTFSFCFPLGETTTYTTTTTESSLRHLRIILHIQGMLFAAMIFGKEGS